jgi:gliding motility-associated-like protein
MKGRRLKLLLLVTLCAAIHGLNAQCPSTTITGNLVPANGDTLGGTYNISGNFIIGPGITVHVRPYRTGGCGELHIIAAGSIQVDGSINANGAGYNGPAGGTLGSANNISFIESCPAPTDQCGAINTLGGGSGGSGNPGGGGNGGAAGLDGSGRKNQCFTFNDDGGRVGGSGGGGGGAGGTYAGIATGGGPGGVGSLPVVNSAVSSCTTLVFAFGFGGNGGTLGSTYGTINGPDIDKGSSGAGAGGGGRGRFAGTSGALGGSGGGRVTLESGGNLAFTGSIQANGTDGSNGGNGGGAGPSPRCCSDACDGVDEYTHTGAGGGGGGAGGGSGGGVLIRVGGVATVTGNIQVNGGNGGAGGSGGAAGPNLSLGGGLFCSTTTANTAAGTGGGSGGAGGGGRIKVFYNACAPGNIVVPTPLLAGGTGNAGAAANGSFYAGTDGSFTLGSAQPATQTVCYLGDPGNLNALPSTGGFGGISYQWQISSNCTGIFANIPGATSLNYDPPSGLALTSCYRLQVSSGTCNNYSDTLTVNVIPPQFASITPSGSVPACIGDTLLLQTSGGTGATYQWLYNGLPIPAAIDSFYLATTTGAYSVQVNYPVGCAGLSAPTTINFDPPPAAFVFLQGDSILCPGEPMQLQGFGQGSFQWQLNTVDIPGAVNSALPVSSPGDYQLVVTTPGGCATTSATQIITPGNAAAATLGSSSPNTFCEGDSVVLNAGGGTVVEWLLGGFSFPQATGNAFTAFSSGNYSVVVQSPDGCLDTSAVVVVLSDTVVAGIDPAANQVACLGDSVLFLATGGGTYAWLFDQQPLSATANFLFGGTQGDYTLVVTSVNGCVDTSATYAFTYYPPVFPVAASVGGTYLCPGDVVTLAGSAPGGVSYQWLLNDTLVPGATSLVYGATSPGVYALQATDQYGCHYASPYFSLYPGADPIAEITPLGTMPICRQDSIVLLGTGGDSLFWYHEGVLVQAGTDSLFTATASGEYVLVVSTGCGRDSSQALEVVVSAGPTAGFFGNNLPENAVEFIDESISGATWLWDFGDGSPTSILQDPTHTFPGPGNYPITMITWDIYGCSDTISTLFEVLDPVFFIPNVFSPNADGINDLAETNFNSLTEIDFKIYDRWGRLMFQTNSKTVYWDGLRNGKQAPDGVYYYHLRATTTSDKPLEAKGNMTLLR